MSDPIGAGMSDRETVRAKAKPNAFLYALEATRLQFLLMLLLIALLIPYALLKTGVAIGIAIQIVLIGCGVIWCFFFVVVMIAAHCIVFLITNKNVIVRMSIMGRVSDKVSIPIESIEAIEVRSYSAHFGSVYLKCNTTSADDDWRSEMSDRSLPTSLRRPVKKPRRPANLVVRSDWTSIWLSMPSSSPPLAGFYGFRHFETFAQLIVKLQNSVTVH